MTDYTNLIARLEATEGPSRELDCEIHEALGHEVILGAGKHPMNRTGGGRVPKYTASLDAAVSLVPEGWEVVLEWYRSEGMARLSRNGLDADSLSAGKTPALALCIAALKAREAE